MIVKAVACASGIFAFIIAAFLLGPSAAAVAGQAVGQPQGSQQLLWGDSDCDGQITSRDNQAALRSILQQNALPQNEPCPDIGASVLVDVPPVSTGLGLSRSNPIPSGQAFTVPEGWELTIVDFTPDATQQVLDENQFNDPPGPGKRFSIVRIRTKNISAGNPADHDVGFALRMVGSENVGYSTFEASCGVIPDSFTFKPDDLFEGGSLEGNICFETANGESDFAIYTNYFLGDDEDVRWLEVN